MDLVIIFDTASMCKLVRQCLNKVSVLICDLVKRTEGVLRRRISLSWRSLGKFPLSWKVPIFHFGVSD